MLLPFLLQANFAGQIIPISGWLYDYQILPSYRQAWLPKDLIEKYTNIPDSVGATTMCIQLLMHTHREAATTELDLLHEELMNLHIECGNTEETEGPFRYSPTLKDGPAF